MALWHIIPVTLILQVAAQNGIFLLSDLYGASFRLPYIFRSVSTRIWDVRKRACDSNSNIRKTWIGKSCCKSTLINMRSTGFAILKSAMLSCVAALILVFAVHALRNFLSIRGAIFTAGTTP